MSIKITKTIGVVVLLAVALAFSVMAASSYNWVRPATPADIINYYFNMTNTTVEEIIFDTIDTFFFLDYDKTIKTNSTLVDNVNITGNLTASKANFTELYVQQNFSIGEFKFIVNDSNMAVQGRN